MILPVEARKIGMGLCLLFFGDRRLRILISWLLRRKWKDLLCMKIKKNRKMWQKIRKIPKRESKARMDGRMMRNNQKMSIGDIKIRRTLAKTIKNDLFKYI